jgi:hypothetical protein
MSVSSIPVPESEAQSSAKPSSDARLRALYLLALAVGVFLMPAWWMVAIAAGAQVLLWLGLGIGVRKLLRQVRKLFLFLAVIQIAYALVTNDPATDRWQTYVLTLFGLGWEIDVNLSGAMVGLTMVLRVLAVVLASQVIRAGDTRAFAAGLRKLGVPRVVALSIDAVLELLGERQKGKGKRRRKRKGRGSEGGRGSGSGGGGGRGSGGGGGRGSGSGSGDGGGSAHAGEEPKAGFVQSLKRLARGDVSLIVDKLYGHVARVESHIAESSPETDRQMARDVAVIAGIALTMLGIKALKLLPGIPFAPGHKGVILIPLYVVAGFMTRSRAGSTLTGLTMGTVAFLLGDGRYGIFEIVKHVAPGVLVDLLMPLMRRSTGQARRGLFAWSMFGLVIALGRYATITAIAFSVQAPALVYALLIPGLTIHAVFGILSGVVTAPLIRALERRESKQPSDERENE